MIAIYIKVALSRRSEGLASKSNCSSSRKGHLRDNYENEDNGSEAELSAGSWSERKRSRKGRSARGYACSVFFFRIAHAAVKIHRLFDRSRYYRVKLAEDAAGAAFYLLPMILERWLGREVSGVVYVLQLPKYITAR